MIYQDANTSVLLDMDLPFKSLSRGNRESTFRGIQTAAGQYENLLFSH